MEAILRALTRWMGKPEERDSQHAAEVDAVLAELEALKAALEDRSSEETIKKLAADLGRLKFEKAELLMVLETVRDEYINIKAEIDELTACLKERT